MLLLSFLVDTTTKFKQVRFSFKFTRKKIFQMADFPTEDIIIENEHPVAVSYEGMATHSGLIGVSTNKKRKSMFNHMTRFLAKYPYHRRESDGGFATTLDELPESAFDDKCTLMGKFSSYLDVEVANVRAWNTHNGLVSALHV